MSAEFKTNVLVVDDDKEIVGAIAALLEREGYNIYRAYDGLMALDAVMSNDIHLMLIDVMMPNMDPFPIWNQSVVPCPVLTVAS